MRFTVSTESIEAARRVLIAIVLAVVFLLINVLFDLAIIPLTLLWQVGLFFVLVLLSLSIGESSAKRLEALEAKQVSASRELYTTLYNQSPIPYLTLNQKGLVSTCNQAALRLLQVNIEDIVGKSITERLSSPNENEYGVALGKLKAGVSIFDTEFEITTFENEKRWVSLSLFVNETFEQQLVSLVDMTHHKAVDTAKSEFVALATHQLRTPIAAIRWNFELLERSARTEATDKQKNYFEKINRNIARMIALINDFLSVSKLETGTFATTFEKINIKDYLETIIEEFGQALTEKQITLHKTYEPVDLQFNTDTRLFHIITSNLLSNAVKYVNPNGHINFSYQVIANQLVVTVSDSGIGIPAEQLDRLFTKFFRANNAQLHKAEGTGLGLYIVKESVTILGGTIEVTTAENKGTAFIVKLPLSQ